MRRFFWTVAVVPLVPLACFSPGAPITVTIESGTLPDLEFPDASLPDVILFSPDAPTTIYEAAPPDAPPPAPVKVTVLGDFGPEANIPLIVADSTGILASVSGLTNAMGVAALQAPAGSSVTAILGGASGMHLVTYVAVEPGDNLTVMDTFDVTSFQPQLLTPEGSSNVIQARVGNCAGYDEELWYLPIQRGCYLAGVFPVLTTMSSEEPPLGYAFKKGVSIETLLEDGGTNTVDLTSATIFNDSSSQGLAVTNLPAALAGEGSVTYSFSEVANAVPYTQESSFSFGADGGVATASFPTHPSYPDFVQSEVDVLPASFSFYSPSSYWAVARRSATPSGSEVFDLSQLPPLTVSAAAQFGTSTVTIAWSSAAPIPSSAGTLIEMLGDSTSWMFVVPPGVTSIVAPATPAAIASIEHDQEDLAVTWDVATVSGSAIPDYAALRGAGGSMLAMLPSPAQGGPVQSVNHAMVPPLPDDGDLIISGYYAGS